MSEAILQARGLTFAFPQQPVFSDVTLTIPAGLTYIVGDESSGKTTLLRLFAGDLAPQSGKIFISGSNQADSVALCKQHVFWVDPRTSEFDQISPKDYFDLQRRVYPDFDDVVLATLIEGLNFSEHLAKAIYMLSAGTKRKVWLAAAFASGATLTLVDEPFAALDKASINFLIKRFEAFSQTAGRALVIADYEVPHNLTTDYTIDLDL